MYRRLESRKVGSADLVRQARKAETDLIGALADSEDEGVIGVRARGSLARLPSSVYWSSLVRWGIFQHRQSQGWYHTNFAKLGGRSRRRRTARRPRRGLDPAAETGIRGCPIRPKSFPQEASFALTRDEADFLRGRLEEQCAGTLLGWLARKGSDTQAEHFWDDPDAGRAPPEIRATVELARRFSLHVQGIPLLYNLLLAERRHADHGGDRGIDRLVPGGACRVVRPTRPGGRLQAACTMGSGSSSRGTFTRAATPFRRGMVEADYREGSPMSWRTTMGCASWSSNASASSKAYGRGS